MHTLLLIISFSILYSAIKREYKKIERAKDWQHRSGLACYILCSAVLLLFAVTLNLWVMDITGCIAHQTHNWDTVVSVLIGGMFWLLLIISIARTVLSQNKVQKVLSLVTPCENEPLLEATAVLSRKMSISQPVLATYKSLKPYAATLFWKEPVILLSSWMLEKLDAEQLEAVIAHELAHIQRKDNLMVSVGGILKDVLFFLPTMQKTWHKFLIDLETAADDVAVLVTGKPAVLASAIVRVHQEQPEMPFAYGISYFTPDYQQIEARVERLLSNDVVRVSKSASIRFSSLLFTREIGLSAVLLVSVLSSIYLIPYCHWALGDHHHNEAIIKKGPY